nr:hypothetical protein [Cytophagales bacterium]
MKTTKISPLILFPMVFLLVGCPGMPPVYEDSTLIFVNNTFTPLTLKLDNVDYTIGEKESLEFTTLPGSNYAYSALTRGLYLDFVSFPNTNVIGPPSGTKTTVEFTVPADYFYMLVKNNSQAPVVRVEVDFDNQPVGLASKPVIPNNGSLYGVGYLSVHASTIIFKSVDCRVCSGVPGSYWLFGDPKNSSLQLTPQPLPSLPGDKNQSIVFELN